MGSSGMMTPSLLLYLSFFALFSPSTPSTVLPSHSQKVSVGLYYESLCPLTVPISSSITSLSSSRMTSSPSSISSSFPGVNSTFDCQNEHFPFIYCVEALVHESKYREWESCFKKLDLDPKSIDKCYTSEYGKEVSDFSLILFNFNVYPWNASLFFGRIFLLCVSASC